MQRHDVGAVEVQALCAEGLNVRAVPDSSGRGDFFPLAVEFYHPGLDHYFLTSSAREIADLDGGAHRGWTRTGQAFRIYVTDPSWPSGQAPLAETCRYYGLPEAGLNSHFYSPSSEECTAVGATWPERWRRETSSAFHVHVPASSDGSCVAGTVPLYRLYNHRADVNHRYTTSPAIRQQMIERGWIPEGHGALGVVMCVRPF